MARVRKSKATIHLDKKADKHIVWKIAVYIRLSREDGNDESESVVNQKKILDEFLANYFTDAYTIVDYYVDDGLTGTDDTRANFARMIDDIYAGKVNCMLCKTLSRAFRNYADQGHYLEFVFPQQDVRFISTGDPQVDTFKNPEAITGLEVPITGLMNDRFACRTSNDIRRTFNTKRRNGEFIGAFPPYGYLKNPANKNHLILDVEIVPVKKDMYYWIVEEGMSLNGVAHKLNDLGIPNPTAYKISKGWKYNNPSSKNCDGLWTGCTVKRILLDKVNLGHMVQGKQRIVSYKVHDRLNVPQDEWFVVENTHEPTFTQAEYDTLERLLQRDTRAPNGERKVHLFAGFLKCFDCGKALQRKSAKNTVYYACRTYTEKSKNKCTKHSIRVDTLEKSVLNAIKAQVFYVAALADIVDEINKSPIVDTQSKRIEKMLKDKANELEKARSISDSLYADWKTGEITQEDYRRMKAKYDEQIAQLTATAENLIKEQRLMGQGVTSEDAIFAEFLKYKNIMELDRNILIELVDTIFIHENKEITIKFKLADDLDRVLEFVEINKNQVMTA